MEHDAFDAFCTHLSELELAPYLWPGEEQQPGTNDTHIKVSWGGAGSRPLSVCGGSSARSRFLVNLLVRSVSGTRYGQLTPLLDAIREAYPLGLRIDANGVNITVTNPVDVRPPYTSDGWYNVPALLTLELLT